MIKLALWSIIGYLFTCIAIMIPTNADNSIKDLVVFLSLIAMVVFHTSFLYPILSKKRKGIYVIIFLASILICTGLEMLIFYDNLVTSYSTFPNANKILLAAFIYIIIRDFAIFIFFLWIEYSNRLILLYYQSEKVHQEEIWLLKEKQEFEKIYSKKTLLPHYFFNIMEYVFAKYLTNKDDREIFDKLNFILYYFLVDADKEVVELDKEVMFYNYYIDLEKIRNPKNIAVNFNVIGQIENYFIVPLLFEPVIGNAMKYTKQDGTGWVEIQIDTTLFPLIRFGCKNNCLPSNTHIVSSEKGLKIFKQRLELCYKDKYTLNIVQHVDFFEVALAITIA